MVGMHKEHLRYVFYCVQSRTLSYLKALPHVRHAQGASPVCFLLCKIKDIILPKSFANVCTIKDIILPQSFANVCTIKDIILPKSFATCKTCIGSISSMFSSMYFPTIMALVFFVTKLAVKCRCRCN